MSPDLTELFLVITLVGPNPVAIDVQIPPAVTEDRDGIGAVAIPIADQRNIARRAVVEDVVDQVGAGGALRRELKRSLAERRLMLGRRHVLLGAVMLVERVGQPRFAAICRGSPAHARPKMPMSSLPSPSQSPTTGLSPS